MTEIKNKEIEALSKIVNALDDLEGNEILRVVEYILKKYIGDIKEAKKAELQAYKNLISKLETKLEQDAIDDLSKS